MFGPKGAAYSNGCMITLRAEASGKKQWELCELLLYELNFWKEAVGALRVITSNSNHTKLALQVITVRAARIQTLLYESWFFDFKPYLTLLYESLLFEYKHKVFFLRCIRLRAARVQNLLYEVLFSEFNLDYAFSTNHYYSNTSIQCSLYES